MVWCNSLGGESLFRLDYPNEARNMETSEQNMPYVQHNTINYIFLAVTNVFSVLKHRRWHRTRFLLCIITMVFTQKGRT